MGARAKEEVGSFWSFGILASTLSDKTGSEVGKCVGVVLSGAMCFGLRVFVAMPKVLALRFVVAMTLGVRDDAPCIGHYG